MSLTLRLSLILSTMVTVAFLAFGWSEYRTLREAVLNEIDETLELRAEQVALALGQATSVQDYLDDPRSPEVYLQILNLDGSVMDSSRNLGSQALPTPFETKTAHHETRQGIDGGRMRLFVLPVVNAQGTVESVVLVSESLRHLDVALNIASRNTLLSGFGTLVIIIGSLALVLSSGLSPLIDVISTAENIVNTGDLSRRIEEPLRKDEVSRVAHSVNLLLDRVEGSIRSQQRLLDDTSHELRNPLMVITTDLEFLTKDLDPETRDEVVNEALRETRRMTVIVEDLRLLNWADSQPDFALEKLDLSGLARRTLERLDVLAQGRDLTIKAKPNILVKGNSDRLRQILTNLVENAIRHTDPGGMIEILISEKGQDAILSVRDDGEGIAPEHKSKIFERFYRADQARTRCSAGSGLGLSICKALVDLHHGKIEVHSELGKGAEFVVLLPRVF